VINFTVVKHLEVSALGGKVVSSITVIFISNLFFPSQSPMSY